ncbi:MAG: hypothetical protein J0I84_13205, partial [Terrimonas sp.]|nr:hypothetical protein [Terrimonas sp.]
MMEQSNAKIFLAKERGKSETGVMRSYKTFNSGNYFNEHKTAFGNLYLLNDDTLAPAETIKMFVEEESYIVFLPVAGGIIYSDSPGHEVTIMAGEAQIKFTLPGTIIEIKNAYEDNLVNYLHIRFRPVAESAPAAPPPAPEPPKIQDAFSGNSHLNDIKPGQLSLGIKSPLETKLDLRAKQKSALRKKQKVEGLFA